MRADPRTPAPPSPTEGKAEPSSKWILVLDDDTGAAELYRQILSQEGFHVLTAPETTKAREYLRIRKPDLILLDLMLPGESGFEFLQALENDPDLRDLPVVLITAKPLDKSMRQMLMAEPSVREFMPKPIKGVILQWRVHEILHTRSQMEQRAEEYRREWEETMRRAGWQPR